MQLFIDRVYEGLLPIAKNGFEGIRSLYADDTEEMQREECVVTFFEEAYEKFGESLSEFIDIIKNKGINGVEVLKDIYSYIHYGERKKLGGNDSGRTDKNGIPKGLETQMEMRNTVPPDGIAEEAKAAGMSYQEYVKQEQERYHKGLVEMAEEAGMTRRNTLLKPIMKTVHF